MTQSWHFRPAGEFQCAQCGALYEVAVVRLAAAIREEAVCQVCQKVMNDWRGSVAPWYKLKIATG
jgi:hypothetical protein